MAKTVSDIFLRLKLEGQQQVSGLKSAFRGLTSTLDVTDKAIDELRRGVKDYTKQSNNSIKVLKGQIEALKDLKEQASIGGTVFKQLADDLKLYERQLKSIEQQANNTAKALSAPQIATRLTKLGVEGLETQLGARRQLLGTQKSLTAEYANTLGEVLQFEAALTRIEQRQAVIAAQARTVTFTPARGGQQTFDLEGLLRYADVFQELPNTSAGLSQRLRELRQDFANLDIGGEDYLRTIREIDRVQKDIARGERIRELTLQDQDLLGRQGTLEAYIESGRGRRTRAAARGADVAEIEAAAKATQKLRDAATLPPREISNLYQQIGGIGMSRIRANIEMMGNSYKRVTADIKAATRASNGSVSSLQAQRAAFARLQQIVPITSRDFRRATAEIERLDRRLNKLNKTSRFSGRALSQIGGASIAGGIFGGPLGFLGGIAGGIIGGPSGAFAGATAGAQANVLVEQAAGMAKYSAELSLAKKTLAQVATNQEEFNILLTKARQISTDYSVDFKETIKGYAQVAVAAKANNLTLEQTESIYRGLIAAGTAFGKTQEDLDALIRATVQVLSKGKVSAEEMSGQIGERLPGAVAKFAAANGKSLAQLADDFKKGKVTIADFVVFTESQLEEYDDLAQTIAQGPEKAGMRLDIALKRAQETYGAFFARIGASFQSNLAEVVNWVNENDAEIKRLLTKFYNFAKGIKDWVRQNKEQLKELYNGFVSFASDLVATFAAVQKSLISVFGPFFRYLAENIVRGMKGLRQLAANATTPAAIHAEAVRNVESLYPEVVDPFQKTRLVEREKKVLRDYYDFKAKGTDLSVNDLFVPPSPTLFGGGGTPLTPSGADTGTDGTGGKSKDISRAQASMLREISNLRRQGLTIQADILEFERALLKTKEDMKNPEKASVDRAKALETFTKARANWFKGIGADIERASKALQEQKKVEADLNKELQDRKYELGLITKEQYNQYLIEQEKKRLQEAYPGEGFAGKRAELGDLYRRQIDPTFKEAGETEVKKMQEDLDAMLKPINQLKQGALAFGQAFSTAFTNVITGAQSAQEAMGTFLKNLGQYFIDYAAKLITQMIAIATIQAVIKALGGPSLGGGSGGGSSSFQPSNIGDSYSSFITNANGNVFNKGLKRYAMGGIVNKPTMFKYADGGTGSFGLMGEAGPEAIIPLRRGPDGRLGVSAFADSRAALSGGGQRTTATAFDEARTSLDGMSTNERERRMERVITSGAGSTEIKYNRVGSGDLPFVTEENMLQATRIAAQEGARLGQARTLAALKNNPGARRSIGI